MTDTSLDQCVWYCSHKNIEYKILVEDWQGCDDQASANSGVHAVVSPFQRHGSLPMLSIFKSYQANTCHSILLGLVLSTYLTIHFMDVFLIPSLSLSTKYLWKPFPWSFCLVKSWRSQGFWSVPIIAGCLAFLCFLSRLSSLVLVVGPFCNLVRGQPLYCL